MVTHTAPLRESSMMWNNTISWNTTNFRSTQLTTTQVISSVGNSRHTDSRGHTNGYVPLTTVVREDTTMLTKEASNVHAVLTPVFATTTGLLLVAVVVLSVLLYRICRKKSGGKSELVINSNNNDYSPTPTRQSAETSLQLEAMGMQQDNSGFRGRVNPSFDQEAEVVTRGIGAGMTDLVKHSKLSDPTGYATTIGNEQPDKQRKYTTLNITGTPTRALPSPTEQLNVINEDLASGRVTSHISATTSVGDETEEIYQNVGGHTKALESKPPSNDYMPMEGHDKEVPQEEVEYVNHNEIAPGLPEDAYEVPLTYSGEHN